MLLPPPSAMCPPQFAPGVATGTQLYAPASGDLLSGWSVQSVTIQTFNLSQQDLLSSGGKPAATCWRARAEGHSAAHLAVGAAGPAPQAALVACCVTRSLSPAMQAAATVCQETHGPSIPRTPTQYLLSACSGRSVRTSLHAHPAGHAVGWHAVLVHCSHCAVPPIVERV